MGPESKIFLITPLLVLMKMGKAGATIPPVGRSSQLSVFEWREDIVEQEAMASPEISKSKRRVRGHKKKSIV